MSISIAANYGGNDRTVLVAPEDIATAAAEELESCITDRNIRYVASDELTCNDVASILGKAIGKPDLQWKFISDEQAQQNLGKAGLRARSAALLVELKAGHHKGITA